MESAENWVLENMSSLSDTSDNYITIGELQQSGYLEAKRVINPITDEEMNGCVVIKYDKSYNQYTYQYNENSCNDIEVENSCDTVILGKKIATGEVVCNDPDLNPRYIGSDPDNYVEFNGELWRIIGKFNGKTKIIRNTNFESTIYYFPVWDQDDSNNWNVSTLQKELNETYLSTIQTNNATHYSYIDLTHSWEIGAVTWDEGYDSTRNQLYNLERANTPAGSTGATATWQGAIGLIYPSDFGYSSSSQISSCETEALHNWNNYEECYSSSWLYDADSYFTITSNSDDSNRVQYVYSRLENSAANESISSRPVLFLKDNVIITSGTGDYNDPYKLGTN